MPTTIVRVYRSVTGAGQIVYFQIQVQGQQFFLSPPQPGLAPIDWVSRVDFLDPDGKILLVVPCYPADSTIYLANGGQVFQFRLELRNFLGGNPIVFQTDLQSYQRPGGPDGNPYKPQIAPCLPSPPAALQPGFQLAGKTTNPPGAAWSTDLSYYVSVVKDLPGYNGLDDSATIDAPQDDTFDPAVSSRPLYSQHTSVLVRWLRTDKTVLPVLCPRRAYQIGPNDPAGTVSLPPPFLFQLPVVDRGNDAGAHVSQFPAISWFNSVDPTKPPLPLRETDIWHFETSAIPFACVKDLWQNRILTPYIMGLRLINAPLPVSLAAWINWDANPPAQGDNTWRLFRTAWLKPINKQNQRLLLPLSERLIPGGYLDSDTKNAQPAIWNVTGEFPCFRTHNGTPLQFSAETMPFANSDLINPTDDEQSTTNPLKPPTPLTPFSSMLFNLTGVQLTSAVPARLRLGSLDLTFGNWSQADLQQNVELDELTFRVDFDPPVSSYAEFVQPGGFTPRLYVHGILPVNSYAPGGQDEPPNVDEFQLTAAPGTDSNRTKFVRSQPIVIDASLVGAGPALLQLAPASYKLQFDERTLTSPQQQQLVLNLQQLTSGGSGAAAPTTPRVLVLDREPFLVAFISLQARPAATPSTDPSLANNIGVWCNLYPEGAGWRLQAGSGGFNLYLPPQAVGEAMVRGFLADDPITAEDTASHTFPTPDQSPIDYRFSPLLSARLQANYFAQNAVEPGWNTRRVLGSAGQQLPGALVDDKNGGVTFELLYGMTAAVTQPNLRLSEIFARLGNFPGPLPDPSGQSSFALPFTTGQAGVYNQASDDWANLYSQLLRRLGALELWDDHQGPDLVIDENVDFTLRNVALQFPPTFNGTLAYAIESENIVDELVAEPNSVAGQLNSPRFTALGGYGAQRAEFAGGKVIIDTRTSMGRIESLTITLVGRIGNLWNHALHVTVYARTVLPSDQFALYQDQLYSRPLLRKTEEYVLITEAQRSYPENSVADPALTGFVLGSSFKSTKINVDSRWGGDVGKIGWQVPLWQKGALPKIVYPKPHIALKVAVDPATGSNAVLGEIDDPEKLCFYTDTQIGTPTQPAPTSDTDTWAVVPEIDWIDQPGTAPDGTGAAFQDPSIEPGFGRFTYHFGDASAQVNIVAQRTSTAVAAKLRNVSMIRGARSANVPDSSLTNTQRIRRVTDWWSAARAYLESAADDADALYASANDVANDAGQAASNALISTGVTDPDALKAAAAKAINDSFAASKAKATQKLNDALAEVQKTYLGNPATQSVAAELTNIASLPSTSCDAVKSRLNSVLNRVDGQKQLIVQTTLQGYLNQLQQELANTQNDVAADLLAAMTTKINAVATEIESDLAPVSGDIQGVVAKITAYQKTAFDPATGFVAQLTSLLKTLKAAAANFNQTTAQDLSTALLQVVPGSPIRTTLEQGAAIVDAATNVFLGGRGTSVLLVIDGAFDALMVQLQGQLNPIPFPGPGPQALISLAQTAVGNLDTTINTAQQACTNAIASLNQLTPSPLNQMVEQLKGSIIQNITAQVGAGTQAMHNAADQFLATYLSGPATAAVNWVNSFVTNQETWIQNSAGSLCQSLQQAFGTLVNDLKNMAQTEISSLLSGFVPADFVGADGFRNALTSISDQFENQLQQVARGAMQEVENITSGANAASLAAALRVIRAFGDPPQVPTMDFAVPQIPLPNIGDISLPAMAYCFNEALPTVDMTPARAVVQQVAEGLGSLSQLSVNLPTKQLLDRLLPDSLQNFDFTSILPHFAGIDLTSLLSGIQMPSVANDTVHVTHHVDPQNRRASLDTDINVPLAGNSTLFDLGPVELRLVGATFTAQVHCEVTVGQQVQQTSSGQIYGDWELLICGMSVVGFTKTTLSFDSSGKVHFDIKPANVRLSEVLQFLADLVNSLDLGIGGFTVHMTTTPIAVQCILDLPLPDMSAGAFGIQNLRLGATFELGYDESFYLSVAANLARETAPFILTVFILGGAGWIEAAVRYQDGKITGLITIGLAASASLAIALGPISGSVSIDFGIFARLAIGGGGGFQLGIMLLVDGRVSILGFVEANISLLLEAEYSSGGGLTGRGVVSVSIKICWCFTLEVHTGVQYTFGSAGGSKGAQALQPQARVAAAVVAPAALAAMGAPAAPPPADPYIPYRNAAVQYVTMLA